MLMAEYWDCFPRELIMKMIKRGELNYVNAHDLYFLLNKFKKYTISVFRANVVNVNRRIGEDFEFITRRDVVVIKMPILYKFDVLVNVLSDDYSERVEMITTEDYFVIILPRDDVMLIEFESFELNKKVYFIFGYGFILIVYSDQNILVVESYPLKFSYHLRKYFVERIIDMNSKEVKSVDDFDYSVIERCILVKDLENIKKRIENFVFRYLRNKYSEHPKSKGRILSLEELERQ